LVLLLAAPLFLGCQSTAGGLASTQWKWPWSKKDPANESSLAGAPATNYPQPPSRNASPDATLASQSYGVPGSTGYSPYSPSPSIGYAAAPTSYTGYPTTPPTESGSVGLYDSQAGGYSGYAASPPASNSYSYPTQGSGATLDNQFYNPDYARSQPMASPQAYPAQAPPPSSMAAYPGAATSAPMYNHATMGPGNYNDYGQQAMAGPPPANNPYAMPETPSTTPAYHTADNRAYNPAGGYGYPASGGYQQAPDSHAAGQPSWNSQTTLPQSGNVGYTADTTSYQPANTGFQPGQTGYTPGNNGYQPPSTTPYQSPAGNYQMPSGRSDTPYRPGSTSSYPRQGASTTPAVDSTVADHVSTVTPASYEGPMPETAPVNPIGTGQ
jgi:hypothetical protein